MDHSLSIEDRIGQHYAGLSDKLKVAADFVAKNPFEIATRSLRSVASASGVSPATFSRLARALNYSDYEEMRDDGRALIGRKGIPFSERAQNLRQTGRDKQGRDLLSEQANACIANIRYLEKDIPAERLEAAVEMLDRARNVLLVGSMGSVGFVDHFGYLAHWFNDNWMTAGRNGTALPSMLARLDARDAIFVLSKSPHATRSIAALKAAHERGIATILITDRHTSPALQYADQAFVMPTESPHFFSSYAATLVLLETIISMLLTRRGAEAEEMIRAAENQVHNLGESWIP